MDEDDVPTFRPDDLEQWLLETPKPIVIDVEPLRMCSEQVELIRNEVIRIVGNLLEHLHTVLPTMPVRRHLRLGTLRTLPGSIFLRSHQTPWGRGAALLHRGIRNCIAQALTENGIPSERVPPDILEPENPENPSSVLSLDLVVTDDPDSTIVIVPENAEATEDGTCPEGALFFSETSAFHIYGTKWKDLPTLPPLPWKIPPIDFSKDHV